MQDCQTVLSSFFPRVKTVYVPMPSEAVSRHALSETLIKRRFEKQGWMVFRGGSFNAHKAADAYPNVKRRYELLCQLMERHKPGVLEYLQYLCTVHHGMPDYICFKSGRFRFVECKLIYEKLSEGQKRCIAKLLRLGFEVEMHYVVDHRTKVRKAIVDIQSGEKKVMDRQTRIRFGKMKRKTRTGSSGPLAFSTNTSQCERVSVRSTA